MRGAKSRTAKRRLPELPRPGCGGHFA